MIRMNWLMLPIIAAAMAVTMGASASDRLVQQTSSNSVFPNTLKIELTETVMGIAPSVPDDLSEVDAKEIPEISEMQYSMLGSVVDGHKIGKAAQIAAKRAHGRSTGKCALYVRKALQAAGYSFTPQRSAYLYNHGILAGAGFSKVPEIGYQPLVGDVVVFDRTAKNPHGHIQIYDGKQWVSDFRQRKFSPYSVHNGYTIWRDTQIIQALDAMQPKGVMLALKD